MVVRLRHRNDDLRVLEPASLPARNVDDVTPWQHHCACWEFAPSYIQQDLCTLRGEQARQVLNGLQILVPVRADDEQLFDCFIANHAAESRADSLAAWPRKERDCCAIA